MKKLIYILLLIAITPNICSSQIYEIGDLSLFKPQDTSVIVIDTYNKAFGPNIEYFMDSYGNLEKMHVLKDTVVKETIFFFYDSLNNIVERLRIKPNLPGDSSVVKYNYEYDENASIKVQIKNSKNRKESCTRIESQTDGAIKYKCLVENLIRDKWRHWTYSKEVEYTPQGKIKKIVNYYKQSTNTFKYSYDSMGRLLQENKIKDPCYSMPERPCWWPMNTLTYEYKKDTAQISTTIMMMAADSTIVHLFNRSVNHK